MKRIREITALYLCRLMYMRDLRFQIQASMHLAIPRLWKYNTAFANL